MNRVLSKTGTVELGKTFRPSLADNWCQSVTEITKTDLEWNVQLPNLEMNLPSMETPRVVCKDYFWFNLNLTNSDLMINIKLYLSKLRGIDKIVSPIEGSIGIASKKGDLHFTNAFVSEKDQLARNGLIDVSQISKKDLANSDYYEKDGSFTIYCALKFWTLKETKSGFSSITTSEVSHKILLETRLEKLLESKTLSDVNLNVGGQTFPAHRNILSSMSEVFATMFEHETIEKLSNQVDIQDIDPDVFQQVLRYIYTGRISAEMMKKMAVGIMAVADKYMLDQLKKECEIHLTNGMSADNCMDLLTLFAQPHPAMHLKKFAVDYLRRYPDKVKATDGWKKAKEDQHFWSYELFEML